jgi:hypothetical protein
MNTRFCANGTILFGPSYVCKDNLQRVIYKLHKAGCPAERKPALTIFKPADSRIAS